MSSCLPSDSHPAVDPQSFALQHPLLEHAQPSSSSQPGHTSPGSPPVPGKRTHSEHLQTSIQTNDPCPVPVPVRPHPSVPDPSTQYGWNQHARSHFSRPPEDIEPYRQEAAVAIFTLHTPVRGSVFQNLSPHTDTFVPFGLLGSCCSACRGSPCASVEGRMRRLWVEPDWTPTRDNLL